MVSITIWNRLEPRCREPDMSPALAARTHDPLWMLARQWQLGELLGDDAGSPIAASVSSSDILLDRYAGPDGVAERIPASMPLEAWVEREGIRPSGTIVDFRQAAEAGLQFLRMLRAASMDRNIPAYLAEYAITASSTTDVARFDAAAARYINVMAGRIPNGVRLVADLRAALPGLPASPTIPDSDRAIVLNVARDFLTWYDSLFDEPSPGTASPPEASVPPPNKAWVNERMEYNFALDASATEAPVALTANRYAGEPLDWTSFDCTAKPLGPVTAPVQPVTRTVIPTPVGFKGMPARRFWEMEDAAVDIGAIEAGPADLGRLILRDFALIYGNDWFLIPIPVRVGSVCRITSLVVTDTFGVPVTVPHYSQTPDGGRWQMFAISGEITLHHLLIPPVLARYIASDPIEQLLLVRDEAADMAWGIERIVQDASGAPVDRASTMPAASPVPPPGAGPRYQLGTSVPDAYIPFIPTLVDTQQQGIRRFRRAAFLRTNGTREIIRPLGRLLAVDVPLFEEEFPREGVKVERRYRLARWTDGSTHLWVARRKQIGATASSSGLKFDSVVEG
jgi:hypothetical protein